MKVLKKIFLFIIKSVIFLNALFWIVVGTKISIDRDLSSARGKGSLIIALIFAIIPVVLYWTANRIFGFDLNRGDNLFQKIKKLFTAKRENRQRPDTLEISKNKYQQEPIPSAKATAMSGNRHKNAIALEKIGESEKQTNVPEKSIKPTGIDLLDDIATKINNLKNSYPYQMFFVRAQQNSISKSLSFLFIISAVIAYFGLIYFVNPPSKFNELLVAQGVMEGYYSKDYSKQVSSTVKIINEKNELVGFSINPKREERKKIENLKGELVTIYYSTGRFLFVIPTHDIRAIKHKDTYVIPYSISLYNRLLAFHENGKIVFIVCAIICFTSLLIIYLRDRKIK